MNPRGLPLLILILLSGEAASWAQVVPSALLENKTPYNLSSLRGVPISTVPGNGSDGRAPTVVGQVANGLTPDSPTTNQFQSLVFFGGFAPVGDWIESNNPAATNNTVRGVRIGAPWMSQRISLLFGDVIAPPDTDELGNKLPPSAPATNSLSFDGVTNYVEVAEVPNGAGLNAYPLTVSAWMKTTDTSGNEGGIINKYRASSWNGYNLYINSGHLFAWYFKDLDDYILGLDGGMVADGAWHHVAFTVDDTGGKLYVDGVQKSTVTWTGTAGAATSPEPVRLGYYPHPDTSGYFRGQIAQAQIWNVARSPLQIQESLYQTPRAGEPGLLAYWEFNEGKGDTVADTAVPADHPGTLLNGGAWAVGEPGVSLDGVDDSVEASQSSELNFYPLTVSARIKTTGDPNNYEAGIVNKYRSSSYDGYNLFLAGGRLQAWYFSGRGSSVYILDGGPVADGAWHHVALAVDADGGRLYVDGVEKSTQPWTGAPAPSSSAEPVRVGSYPGGYGGYFKGQINDVQVWNVARSAQEIADSVAASPSGDEPGLVLYWKFTEGSGITVADASAAQGNQGLLMNGPAWKSESVIPGADLYWLAQPNRSSYTVVATNTVQVTNTVITPGTPPTTNTTYTVNTTVTTNEVLNPDYYWSPHARKVFATQPGPIAIEWRKALPTGTSKPADPPSGSNYRYELFSGLWYVVYTRNYVVSSSPVQSPRHIYWTEGVFRDTGKPVNVPAARVPAVKVVYNRLFPERVEHEYQAAGQSLITESNRLEELRTLWYDQSLGQILAYNREGRVFMELLGDTIEGSRRQHLGFEIVDVIRQPSPDDVTVELGERLTAYPGGVPSDADLFPEPLSLVGQPFAFRHNISGSSRVEYFATRETQFLNDYLVYWIEEGREGLRWPFRFVRYKLVWPDDVAKYSHYLRPLVATEEEAKATAVQLPRDNAPTIEYQDPLDQPRAKLTEKFELYTFLTPTYPAHRTLIRYVSGDEVAFERVFSWLDEGLKQPNYANNIMRSLRGWDSDAAHRWETNANSAPRLLTQTIEVGQRIDPPNGETATNAAGAYLAGYVQQKNGDAFNVNAYVDPFANGFEAAALGAIIPVNAIPAQNSQLEVWWFRGNQGQGRSTQLDPTQGFRNTYWPSVIATYNIVWPEFSASEIVLASGVGSGLLHDPNQAAGRIYSQPDKTMAGYNPNEEHALMLDEKAWAIRDDLNITSGPNFSSLPYVLLEYDGPDHRPAMRAFKVLREKPADGLTFDYTQAAGTVLQPPMPLAKLGAPLAPKRPGLPRLTLNQETGPALVSGATSEDTMVSVRRPPEDGGNVSGTVQVTHVTTTVQAPFQPWQPLVIQNLSDLSQQEWFYPTGQVTPTRLTGFASSRPLIEGNLLAGNTGAPVYEISDPTVLPLSGILPMLDPKTKIARQALVLANSSNSVTLAWYPIIEEPAHVLLVETEAVPGDLAGWRLGTEALPPGLTNEAQLQGLYAGYTFKDRKGETLIYRGPHHPDQPGFMTMQFYYQTLPTFFFPSLPLDQQPPVGTITPYLTPRKPDGTPATETVFGNRDADDQSGDGNALPILYRPYWPADTPVLDMAQTLTKPWKGLPDVRGQTSLQILYQQSVATNGVAFRSAVLHDSTRRKTFDFGPPGQPQVLTILDRIPESIATATENGRTYFPGLPPHLVTRFYVDPDLSPYGSLVFKGEFFDETVGESYILPNVLGSLDMETLKNLAAGDDRATLWNKAIEGLVTPMKLFAEDPNKAGTYIPVSTNLVYSTNLAELTDDDVAKDSYALTAVGPGSGYVTLIANNGLPNSTPVEDPVNIYILRVTNELHRGELKVIESSNPLSETLTMQQVVDLAGQADDYEFEWRIAPPEDGLPPTVYDTRSGVPVDVTSTSGKWLPLLPADRYRDGVRAVLGGNADVQALSDNYLIMRYRAKNPNHASWVSAPGNPSENIGWSLWTPADVLAEGWIKRVLKGINPFNQRVTDLLNNPINTDVSLLAQAGHKWEGDVALN
jgi:Concanavalin A-like lectin/glucanases superfamily